MFGFTDISFDKYGWLTGPIFQEKEDIIFGNADRYDEHSILHVGRGLLPVWTYALNYTYGTAGGGWALSVYGKQFASRETAVDFGLSELKAKIQSKIGDTDTTNF